MRLDDFNVSSIKTANQIKRVLPKIINGDQSGFLKGRSIAENIFLIDGIINYAGNMNKPGLLMFIDFEKGLSKFAFSTAIDLVLLIEMLGDIIYTRANLQVRLPP